MPKQKSDKSSKVASPHQQPENASHNGIPSPAQDMPRDYSISLDTYTKGGTDNFLLNPPQKRIQAMSGFEEQYTDIIPFKHRAIFFKIINVAAFIELKISVLRGAFVFRWPAQ